MQRLCFTVSFIGALIIMASFSVKSSRTENWKENKIRQLRVLCYNIHHCNPPSKPDLIDINAIASVINHQKPDLVALQEVDVNTGRSGNVDQAKILAEKTGMNVFFAKAIDYDGGEYGVAILSKFDILESSKHALPSKASTKGEPRILATVKVKTPEGITFIFGSTHLDSQKADTNRLLQIKQIGKIAESQTLPMIVAGDFNDAGGSKLIQILDQHFQRTCSTCNPTIPVSDPSRAIDFIAYRPAGKFKVISQKVIRETYASDHLPVFSILEIK